MKKYLPETLFLVSFIVINIFPLGCFSSSPNSVPPTLYEPYPTIPTTPSNGMLNGNDYINALQCIVSDRTASQILKDSARSKITSVKNQMQQTGSNVIKIDPSEIQYFYSNSPNCPFNNFLNY